MPRPTGSALMEKIVSLCKRRGFIFPSSEIYGGLNGFWDYGPLGVELKNNLRDRWWDAMVRNPPAGPDGHELDIVGLDCAIVSHPRIWEASGHIESFADPMVDCKKCKARFRADQL
ncbi:MAG TPA: glycine--tRNA ligase, partial [Chloroflexota bacterium]|nr:glycine--tRNA ligase [Chloroflexota bacterium]